MPRIPQLTEAPDGLLDETKRQLGRTPNLYAALANSPAALRAYRPCGTRSRQAG